MKQSLRILLAAASIGAAALAVLFIGLAWLPLTFALYAGQSLAYAMTGIYFLGRAPAHALFVGFFGSVLVAMVTRVTQGHSGQMLSMPKAAWWAFIVVQIVAIARIGAELADDPAAWMAYAAAGWLLALAPWVQRIGRIYLSPRADGKPYAEYPAVALEAVDEGGFFKRLIDTIRLWFA